MADAITILHDSFGPVGPLKKNWGFAALVEFGGRRILFVHTEIDPAFEGRGLGSQLASAALDATRATGERIVPFCPFIANYVEHHPEYADLVDHELMAQLEG